MLWKEDTGRHPGLVCHRVGDPRIQGEQQRVGHPPGSLNEEHGVGQLEETQISVLVA